MNALMQSSAAVQYRLASDPSNGVPLYSFPAGSHPRAQADQPAILTHPLPWFICKTRSRMEKALAEHLSNPATAGFGTSFPHFLPLIHKRGKNRAISSSPMFPGFIFVSPPRIPAFSANSRNPKVPIGLVELDVQRAVSIAVEACRSSKACCGFIFASNQPLLRLELLALSDLSCRIEAALDPSSPGAIASAEAEAARRREFLGGIRHGQLVAVTTPNPMAGLTGTVFFPESGPPPDPTRPNVRLLIQLHMLGRKVSVEVPVAHLSAIEASDPAIPRANVALDGALSGSFTLETA